MLCPEEDGLLYCQRLGWYLKCRLVTREAFIDHWLCYRPNCHRNGEPQIAGLHDWKPFDTKANSQQKYPCSQYSTILCVTIFKREKFWCCCVFAWRSIQSCESPRDPPRWQLGRRKLSPVLGDRKKSHAVSSIALVIIRNTEMVYWLLFKRRDGWSTEQCCRRTEESSSMSNFHWSIL